MRKSGRQYMVNIQSWRSKLALFACILTMVCSSTSIVMTFFWYVDNDVSPLQSFRYFTTISNTLTLIASAFITPFAVEGIRKKRFVVPKWLSLIFYSGAICTTIVFMFAVVFILPYDRDFAIGGKQFFLHIVCPIAVLVSYELAEVNYTFSLRDKHLCLIPFILYTIVYIWNVLIVGEENGGWKDMYMLNTILPAYLSFPIVWGLAFIVAVLINKISVRFRKIREEKTFEGWKEDADPIEVNIEIYGLGRHYGLHSDKNSLTVPLDLIDAIAERYNRDRDELYNIYMKGLLHGNATREEMNKY